MHRISRETRMKTVTAFRPTSTSCAGDSNESDAVHLGLLHLRHIVHNALLERVDHHLEDRSLVQVVAGGLRTNTHETGTGTFLLVCQQKYARTKQHPNDHATHAPKGNNKHTPRSASLEGERGIIQCSSTLFKAQRREVRWGKLEENASPSRTKRIDADRKQRYTRG